MNLMTEHVRKSVCALFICIWAGAMMVAQQISAPLPQAGTIVGTVVDASGNTVENATIQLRGTAADDQRTEVTQDNGFFKLGEVKRGIPFRVIVNAKGLVMLCCLTPASGPALLLPRHRHKEVPLAACHLRPAFHPRRQRATADQLLQHKQRRDLGFSRQRVLSG